MPPTRAGQYPLTGDPMHIRYTNFEGDWHTDCPFCGNSQRDHQVDLGELDGVRYIHRQPCVEEQKHITKQHLIRANMYRIIMTFYEVIIYLWNKIPFKEDAKLLFRIVQRTYVGVRGIFHYWLIYRKTK